jgi:hypothetical protein
MSKPVAMRLQERTTLLDRESSGFGRECFCLDEPSHPVIL